MERESAYNWFFWDALWVQDKDDDVKVSGKSTALYFGDRTRPWLGFFGMGTLSLLLLAGNRGGLGVYG